MFFILTTAWKSKVLLSVTSFGGEPSKTSFSSAGGVVEPTKNGKEIFGFASPLQTTK